MNCLHCGKPLMHATKRKLYCDSKCQVAAWNKRRPRPTEKTTYSVTVTYTDTDGKQLTTVGTGRRKAEAREDADSQVPAWFLARGLLTTYASTPQSILRSLKRSPDAA